MALAKIFFHQNIRFLRERRRFSQEDFAQRIGITRVKLHALESGRTKNPTAEDFVKFSEYFKISIDALLKTDLSKLGEIKLRDLEAGNDVYMSGEKMRVLAITVDKNNRENVEYVPVKAKAGYLRGYSDPEFLATLPKISKPNLPKHGTFRTFPIEGESMLPIPDNSDVTVQYIEDWRTIKPGTPCLLTLEGDPREIVFKMVTVQGNELLLQSLNTEYKPYTIPAADVLEIWSFYSYETKQFPEPASELQSIGEHVRQILCQLQKVKK
ncbi:helix-turn-helix domain-containing protein [Niabella sp. CC-SYL272]|uniref:XRE family transcriptional regulator n=1 Tax=Niabella agricola TaxID=2891571 RepID=UPI001F198353|nr:helix-turn-helix domain-containing protein [Niabella agricola]MCF3109559.1 helix-turn-helix domain-containing protein [Niabella agricola]